MAITEASKTAIMAYRERLKASWSSKGKELARLQAAGAALVAERAAMKLVYEALEADIAEPTVSEEPV